MMEKMAPSFSDSYSDDRIPVALAIAFHSINKRAMQKKSFLTVSKNAVGNVEAVVSDEFIKTSPFMIRSSGERNGGTFRQGKGRQNTLERYKARGSRRNGVSERSELDRVVLKQTLTQYCSLVNQEEVLMMSSRH